MTQDGLSRAGGVGSSDCAIRNADANHWTNILRRRYTLARIDLWRLARPFPTGDERRGEGRRNDTDSLAWFGLFSVQTIGESTLLRSDQDETLGLQREVRQLGCVIKACQTLKAVWPSGMDEPILPQQLEDKGLAQ